MRRRRPCVGGAGRDHHHLLSVLSAGDHVLVTDDVYRPSRNFCNGMLARYGVEISYFDPHAGAGIEGLFKPNTKAVLVETPGSQSFEMTDIPAIAEIAYARGARVIDDNTWATPLFHRSLDQGVDISMRAAHQIYRRPFRHHVGDDENVDDLKADLDRGFAALKAAA